MVAGEPSSPSKTTSRPANSLLMLQVASPPGEQLQGTPEARQGPKSSLVALDVVAEVSGFFFEFGDPGFHHVANTDQTAQCPAG